MKESTLGGFSFPKYENPPQAPPPGTEQRGVLVAFADIHRPPPAFLSTSADERGESRRRFVWPENQYSKTRKFTTLLTYDDEEKLGMALDDSYPRR